MGCTTSTEHLPDVPHYQTTISNPRLERASSRTIFNDQLDRALAVVKQVLDNTKSAQLADSVPHSYEDKYGLAETLTNTCLASYAGSLDVLGLSVEHHEQLAEWALTRCISLRFECSRSCKFNQQVERNLDSKHRVTTNGSDFKVVTAVNDYFWDYGVSTQLVAFVGTGGDGDLVLHSTECVKQVVTSSDRMPFPEVQNTSRSPEMEVEISWLVSKLSEARSGNSFTIDRDHKDTRTPRRNLEVEEAQLQIRKLGAWSTVVAAFVSEELMSVRVCGRGSSVDVTLINADQIVSPVLPLFDAQRGAAAEASSSPGLMHSDLTLLLQDEKRRLEQQCERMAVIFDPDGATSTAAVAFQDGDGDTIKFEAQESNSNGDPTRSLMMSANDDAPVAVEWLRWNCVDRKLTDPGGVIPVPQAFDIVLLEHLAESTNCSWIVQVFQFQDRDGDNIRFEIQGGQLVEIVNEDAPLKIKWLKWNPSERKLTDPGGVIPIPPSVRVDLLEKLAASATDPKCSWVVEGPPLQGRPLVTAQLASLVVVMLHIRQVQAQYVRSIDFIEEMLVQQLVAAIGKVVQPSDFAEYMNFHNNKLFKAQFRPKPCSYAVRQTAAHAPQGVISIEAASSPAALATPISTIVKHSQATADMTIRLSASTEIAFGGDRFVHGFLRHSFSGQPTPPLSLTARARQFSSYIVLLGHVSGPNSFDPTHAMIVRNKDEITIPLDIETIPTAQEFRDAIESLSPEQQQFCQAFRGFQLESTLFGFVVIQLRPQLEKLLNLAPDSLTKEVQLTEHLLELIMTYQIPSDLLAYQQQDEEIAEKDPRRLDAVRARTQSMNAMVEAEKQVELKEKRATEALAAARRAAEQEATRRAARQAVELRASRSSLIEHASARKELCSSPQRFMESSCAVKSRGGFLSSVGAMFSNSSAKESAPARKMKKGGAKKSAPAPATPPPAAPPPPPAAANTTSTTSAADAVPTSEPKANKQQQQPSTADDVVSGLAYTDIPKVLEARFDQLDADSSVRPTIIKPGTSWTKRSQQSLLAAPTLATVSADRLKDAKNQAFDLLDGLTRAGALSCDHASLHVVIAGTQCFDKTLMDTIIQDNINPIIKVQRSSLIVATTIHETPVLELVDVELEKDELESAIQGTDGEGL